MRTTFTRTGTLSAAAALALLASPGFAQAAGPVVGTFPIDQHESVLQPESDICGYPIAWDVTGTGRFQAFFDDEGELVRAHVSGVSSGTLSANGKQVVVRAALQRFSDYVNGTTTEAGLVFQYAGPGGVVLMDRGRLVFPHDPDTGEVLYDAPQFEAGPHPFLHGDVGTLCEVLAP